MTVDFSKIQTEILIRKFSGQYLPWTRCIRKRGWYYLWRIFKNNFEGTGTLKEPDGRLYSGEFKDGRLMDTGFKRIPVEFAIWVTGQKVYGMEWEQSILVMVQILQVSFSSGLAIDSQYDWG